MKITSEKEGIFFKFYWHNMNKKISVSVISITMDSMFPLEVWVIN